MKKMTENEQDIAQTCLPPGTVAAQNSMLNIFNREVRYLKAKDVKRAYSKLVQDFCKGSIQNEFAKTLAILFSGYLRVVKDIDFEDRIKQLEIKSDQIENFNTEQE
jgi:hypothetical protein